MNTCPACQAQQDAGLLCSACCDVLERDLRSVPDLVAELDITLSKQARIGVAGAPGLARERTPINVGAMLVADDLANVLASWVIDVCGEDWPFGRRAGAASFARDLLSHVPEIRRHPAVEELIDEVTDAIKQARRVIDRPADKVYLGQCLVETPDDQGRQVTCLADVYARTTASQVKCGVCGITHEVTERRAWLLEQARDRLFTVKEAAQMMGDVGRIKVTEASIRGYVHRGRIAYHTGTMIRLGDLLTVVIDDSERRSA